MRLSRSLSTTTVDLFGRRRARHLSTSSWVGAVWIVVACEVLWLLLGVAWKPADDHWAVHVAHDELWLGSPPGPGGALRPFLVLNLVVVVALWLAFRSARRERTPTARGLMAAALAAAVVFAALSYLVIQFRGSRPDLFVRERIELEPDGTYRRDAFPDPGAPLGVPDAERGRAGAAAER
jgi:hypothetical protein